MEVTDAYASTTTYRDLISKTDTAEDAEIDGDLKAVSRYLDRRLGRFFTKDASAVARTYMRGPQTDPRILWVDDIAASPTSIKIDDDNDGSFADETALAAADFELWPLNAGKGAEPQPWTMIYLPKSGSKGNWPAGHRVEVTAQWGWPAIPGCHREGDRAPHGDPATGNAQGHAADPRARRRGGGEPRGAEHRPRTGGRVPPGVVLMAGRHGVVSRISRPPPSSSGHVRLSPLPLGEGQGEGLCITPSTQSSSRGRGSHRSPASSGDGRGEGGRGSDSGRREGF